MEEGTREGEVCANFQTAVELIGKRWTGAILWALGDGPVFFAQITQSIPGLSDRLLSRRLRELETAGLVAREVHAGTPPRVSYELTTMGAELGPAIDELGEWARRWEVG